MFSCRDAAFAKQDSPGNLSSGYNEINISVFPVSS